MPTSQARKGRACCLHSGEDAEDQELKAPTDEAFRKAALTAKKAKEEEPKRASY